MSHSEFDEKELNWAELAPTEPTEATTAPPQDEAKEVDPVRSAAGRLGGRRVHDLARLGKEYEREHGLTPGRQRWRQLIQLGKRYEQDHGLATRRSRKPKEDPWVEFLHALSRLVKPRHRAKVETLVQALKTSATEPSDAAPAADGDVPADRN